MFESVASADVAANRRSMLPWVLFLQAVNRRPCSYPAHSRRGKTPREAAGAPARTEVHSTLPLQSLPRRPESRRECSRRKTAAVGVVGLLLARAPFRSVCRVKNIDISPWNSHQGPSTRVALNSTALNTGVFNTAGLKETRVKETWKKLPR